MANEHVMTLDNPAGLLITPELLQQIGVGEGDKIEIKIIDNALMVRPLRDLEDEREEQMMDEIMESLIERRRTLYERLAEGAK